MLIISEDEWALANDYFQRKPHKTKFKKVKHGTFHSFVQLQVDDPENTKSIFAIANEYFDGIPLLGEGGTAKVKRSKNQAGSEFALKIQRGNASLALRQDHEPSLQIMRAFHFYKGQALRSYPDKIIKYYEENRIYKKRYTLLELIEGDCLIDVMERDYKTHFLTSLQKHLIALSLCLCVQELHNNNYIHGDLKPENFMIRLCDNYIIARLVDFDFSLILNLDGCATWISARGTKKYAAPEIVSFKRYSPSSDVFALGVIFKYLGLTELSLKMRQNVPHSRLLLPHVISLLIDDIKTHFDISDPNTHEKISYALFSTHQNIKDFLKTNPSMETLIDLKIFKNFLTYPQRCIIGLLCCQAVLSIYRQGRKGLKLIPKNFQLTLDDQQIVVSVSTEKLQGSPQNFEAADVYALGLLLKKMGIYVEEMLVLEPEFRASLLQAIHLLITHFPACNEHLINKMLAEIKDNLRQNTTSLNISLSSSLILNLPIPDPMLISSPSPVSTTSPHSIHSTTQSRDCDIVQLTSKLASLTLETPAAAAAAATPVEASAEVSPSTRVTAAPPTDSSPQSFLSFRRLFRTRRKEPKEPSSAGTTEKESKEIKKDKKRFFRF